VRAINLLPKDDARRSAKQQKKQWIVAIPVVIALLLTVALAAAFLNASGKVKSKQAELTGLKAELAAIPTPDVSKVQSQNALAAEKQTRVTALNAALSHRVAWDRVLRELSLVLPNDVWLTTVSAKAPVSSSVAAAPAAPAAGTVAATGLTLDGYTYSHAAVARLLSRLAVIPDIGNVQLQQSQLAKVGNQQVVHFTIAADVHSPGSSS
jgi:Tfp pilus assembly protein PilN